MVEVKMYSKDKCSLCDKGLAILHELQKEFSFSIEVVDIYQDDNLLELYQVMIPVITIEDEIIEFGIVEKYNLRKRLLIKSQETILD
ncbi:glutaredoxin family protein [Metabacillus herbersteinensis]|uniref:Glutaredoxin family protein n=1 Tax=Metabacillus herbersteinensis TaxID=283816 RepID=A0ABV6GLS0_9BACI